jgi:hypothetical protein
MQIAMMRRVVMRRLMRASCRWIKRLARAAEFGFAAL